MGQSLLKRIPLNKIRENPSALRAVNRQTEEYEGLVDSIKNRGVLNPILVREINDPDSPDTLYGLIDGLHRYTASLDAGLPDIPAQVIQADDADVMEAQLITNVQKIETKPGEYTKHLQRILAGNPLLTITQLAAKLSKSGAWLSERLNLTKLNERIIGLLDEGKVNLSNAYALSKLPPDEQNHFLDRAMTMTPNEFGPTVLARKKEIDAAKRQGRDVKPAEFIPVPFLQKTSEIKNEVDRPAIGPLLCRENGLTTPEQGFLLALKWVLHLDPRSIEAAKIREEQRKLANEEKKRAAKMERDAKKAAEAAEAAAVASV